MGLWFISIYCRNIDISCILSCHSIYRYMPLGLWKFDIDYQYLKCRCVSYGVDEISIYRNDIIEVIYQDIRYIDSLIQICMMYPMLKSISALHATRIAQIQKFHIEYRYVVTIMSIHRCRMYPKLCWYIDNTVTTYWYINFFGTDISDIDIRFKISNWHIEKSRSPRYY